jgi:hypothetical protein
LQQDSALAHRIKHASAIVLLQVLEVEIQQ